ncbi:MAG: hypothetical protein A2792_06445 [Sphingomonadales bacterium RIFCSPHIGHO2_01_FULL_65_20]|nr:MAG: hypothetical protein A2792_06445 [Sphingomonadales bacterium RIFCSPHIGHO2_01_FULL_65_20]
MSVTELKSYLQQYRNHKPRLLDLIKDLEGIATSEIQDIRQRALAIVATWNSPSQQKLATIKQSLGTPIMTRPLMNKSFVDLELMAERNWDNRAELDLIRSELVHRTTNAAKTLRHRVETWIKDCDKAAAGKSAKPEAAKADAAKPAAKPPRHPQVHSWTYEAVAKLRAKLIDLSRKSPLIAFRHESRSASQLRIIDERPDLLFERLGKGSMGFEPLPGEEQTPADERTPSFGLAYERARLTDTEFLAATEKLGDAEGDVRAWTDAERALRARVRQQLGLPKLDFGKGLDVTALARAHGFDPSYELKMSDDGDVAAHHEDDDMRVLLTRKELDRRLKSIDDRATSHLRETGHHTLHLAFGFVQWFEDDASDLASYAPLLLLPVKLAKDTSRAKKDYRLSIWEGGLEVNVALIEKAREHWGLQLPQLRNEESPESYFIRVKTVLAQGRRLTLRSFITLSVLPPMILWRDLDPENWQEGAFSDHRLLPGLVGAAEVPSVPGDDSIIDIDDPANEARVPALITDADASQHKAIMDMAAGRDMAIEGPPGTGKSQTITNMIATALSQGKRVLFVAEKQAALRVVSDRLRAAGFGPLLLELHGEKASRTEVYAGVRERIVAEPRLDARVLDEKRAELRRHRDLLRRYLSLVRTPLGKLGMTAHALVWREVRLRKQFDREKTRPIEARWQSAGVGELDRSTLTENREILAQFGKAFLAVQGDAEGEATRWVQAGKLNPFDQSAALEAAGAAGRAADAVADVAARLFELGIALPGPSDNAIVDASAQLSAFKPFSCSDEAVVSAALHHRAASLDLLAAQSEWRRQRDAIADAIEAPERVSIDEAQALADALVIGDCPATPAEAGSILSHHERLSGLLEGATRDMERLAAKLADGARTPSENAQKVAAVLARLGQAPASVAALVSSSLIEAASESAIANATREAEALRAERDIVVALTQADALTADPSELDELADTVETTGAIARLFSGRYKAAWRRVGRLCADTSDRAEAASSLRRAAGFLRARRAFHDESKGRVLFPPMLWDGLDSDFESLGAARALVAETARELAASNETAVLRGWLAADESERQSLSACSDRMTGLLAEVAEAGLAEVPLADLAARCDDRAAEMRRILSASQTVRLKDDATFLRSTGETIAEAVLRLHAAKEAFGSLKSQDPFSWVGDVTAPLDSLEASLAHLDHLFAVSGPVQLRAIIGEVEAPAAWLSSVIAYSGALQNAINGWVSSSAHLRDDVDLNVAGLCDGMPWQDAAAVFHAMSADREGVSLAADLLKYRAAVAARDLTPFAEAATHHGIAPGLLDDLYELTAVSALLRSYLGADGQELGRLGSLSLDAARQSFKRVDKDLHKLEATAIVAKRLGDRPPVGVGHGKRSDFTELRLLEHEVGLTRPRTPLRDVVHRAGQALQALQPVWMMSPTSIAQFIRPGSLSFDLLIIDEASQMRPEFSVSCILRADQFVVVGDANQLPPSDHFQVASLDGEGDSDGVGVDEGTESILDLAKQRFRTQPRLKWHYRSQHESLIQFSNREFYERDLVVFPSPQANDDPLMGVKCYYAPAFYSDTAYESSINQREAELVIEQAFGLMQTHPERSIGIVAMNAKQTELLKNEFERLKVEEERVRKYVEAFEGTLDEFFIKNLENVQGDERDIILISTVYGPDKNGVVRQNFGLMNREVGWRRLNVLVTRAKMSCRLITSLRPDDIKVTEKSSKGVIKFKSYLTYAHGGAQYEDGSGGETDSDFEIFVADALRGGGYDVVYQVGVEKFRIDLGVRHASCPVGFIAGIECDGAPYHSGLSVRDRDHIRQTILENLGWNIYRVWSTDWFADPARETAKLLAWLERVRERIVRELGTQAETLQVQKPKSAVIQPPMPQPEPRAEDAAALMPRIDELLPAAEPSEAPREPRGRQLRTIGDFQAFEAVRGNLYEIWKDDTFLGEVEVVRRATSAPRLFGDRALAAQSEYEGRVEASGDCFRSYDLYAAMREVASRASEAL